jgi:hypothetical protein
LWLIGAASLVWFRSRLEAIVSQCDPARVPVTEPLAPYAEGFCAELARQGYAPSSTGSQTRTDQTREVWREVRRKPIPVAVAHRVDRALVPGAPEEPGHLVLERLLQDQPRAQPTDPLHRIKLGVDTGQHVIEFAAKPLARGYSRHAGVPPSASTRQVKAEATPALLSPGSWDGTAHDHWPALRHRGRDRHGLSNARVEQLNTQLRLITRRAFGFHSPDAAIALAMLSLGGLCPPLPGRWNDPRNRQEVLYSPPHS